MDSNTERKMLIDARDLYYAGKHDEALNVYQELAQKGSICALEFLGGFYMESAKSGGKKVDKDYVKAKYLLKKAADSGSIKAHYLLGIIAFKSNSIDEAVKQFTIAMESGYSAACYQLGKMYYFGSGVRQDKDKAYKLFYNAESMGHIFGKRQRAVMLLKGHKGVACIPMGIALFFLSVLAGVRTAFKDPYGESTFD